MRVPILAAVAASVALFALPAAPHGWVERLGDTVVTARQCPLPAPTAAHAAVRCPFVVASPVKERVGRIYHHHGMAMRDDGDRGAPDARGRALVDAAIHNEDEDRRGWDDHEYAQRDGGLRPDIGDARGRLYHETLGRAFLPGEHWIGPCGCGPAYGDLMWSAKLAPEAGPDQPDSDIHP